MSKIRLADYLTNYLVSIGVKNVFMLSGTGSIHLDDAFAHQKGMRYVCARHEAAAVLMAEASAKLTGKVGVVVATTGPGGTNAIGGVVEAWVDSAPIIVISGQVNTDQISKGVRSFGVQGFNIIENVKKITKYAKQIRNPLKIRYHLEKAIYKATIGRPGPVWLDIPLDIQSVKINSEELISYKRNNSIIKTKNNNIKNIINVLNKSKKPLIVFGNGIRNAKAIKEFEKMLEKIKTPSLTARMGLDILEYPNPHFFGLGGIRGQKAPAIILKESDLVIAIGTSFTHAFAGEKYDQLKPSAKLVMVNIDNTEMSKPGLNVDISLQMDVKEFILLMIENSDKVKVDFSKWTNRCRKLKNDFQTVLASYKSNPINSYYFIESLNKNSKEHHIFVNDAGSANYICSQALKIKKGQRELTSGALYSMGIALPLAIGAAVTQPESQILAVTGDGSIELNIQELRTMEQNKLNIKLFIINNGGYASIRKSQDDFVGGRYTDDEEVLNFSKLADAFKLSFHIIEDYRIMDKQVSDILSINGPALIEVVCDPKQEIIEPFI